MGDVVKALVSAPANAVLLVAGLAFLAVAIFRRVTDRLDAGPKGRLFAGMLGIVLIGISLYVSSVGGTPTSTNPPAAITEPAQSSGQPATATAQPSGDYPVELSAGQVVKEEDRTYTILKISLDRYGTDQLALSFTVRVLNQTNYPGNFWDANFRLLADGVPLAPFSNLNELVDGNAAKDGVVKFAFPANTKTLALQIDKFGPDVAGLPITLPSR